MNLRCLFAHDWNKDCEKCARCGSTRVSAHDWSKDKGKCARCGSMRIVAHDLSGDKGKHAMNDKAEPELGSQKMTLKRAATDGRTEAVALILKGAPAPSVYEVQESLRSAAKAGHTDICEMLANTLARTDPVRLTNAMHEMLRDRLPLQVVEMLVEKGADINDQSDIVGFSALHYAASGGNVEAVEWLLEHGALIESRGRKGSTPLCQAAHNGHAAVVQTLIFRGASMSVQDEFGGIAAVCDAAFYGHVEVLGVLLANGCDVNAKNRSGATPLHYAAGHGQTEAVRFLIAHGADVNARTEKGETALDHARENRSAEIVSLLITPKGQPSSVQLATPSGLPASLQPVIATPLSSRPGLNLDAPGGGVAWQSLKPDTVLMGQLGPSAATVVTCGGGTATGVHFLRLGSLNQGLDLVNAHILPFMQIVSPDIAKPASYMRGPVRRCSTAKFQDALVREFGEWSSQKRSDSFNIMICNDKSCLSLEANTNPRGGTSSFFWILVWRTGEDEVSVFGLDDVS